MAGLQGTSWSHLQTRGCVFTWTLGAAACAQPGSVFLIREASEAAEARESHLKMRRCFLLVHEGLKHVNVGLKNIRLLDVRINDV